MESISQELFMMKRNACTDWTIQTVQRWDYHYETTLTSKSANYKLFYVTGPDNAGNMISKHFIIQ